MLRQKQAKLLEEIYQVACKRKGVMVAESLLQSLLDRDAVTRPLINSFISSFLGSNVYVIKYLVNKSEDQWLKAFEESIVDILMEKYEEVLTWVAIEKLP